MLHDAVGIWSNVLTWKSCRELNRNCSVSTGFHRGTGVVCRCRAITCSRNRHGHNTYHFEILHLFLSSGASNSGEDSTVAFQILSRGRSSLAHGGDDRFKRGMIASHEFTVVNRRLTSFSVRQSPYRCPRSMGNGRAAFVTCRARLWRAHSPRVKLQIGVVSADYLRDSGTPHHWPVLM